MSKFIDGIDGLPVRVQDNNERDLRQILKFLVLPDGSGLFLEFGKIITAKEKQFILKVYKRLNP